MSTVGRQTPRLPNLLKALPEGLLATSEWLKKRGVSRQLAAKYVESGWLESPARGVYRKPGEPLGWENVVTSLRWLGYGVHVGGLSAVSVLGASHYLHLGKQLQVHLYAFRSPPSWVSQVTPDVAYSVVRNKLFRESPNRELAMTTVDWRLSEHPLPVSSLERAALEVLERVPAEVSFESADKLMEGFFNLRPQVLMELLTGCTSIRVKRLFLWFAQRHGHAWFRRLDAKRIALGTGKRQIVPGGRLDSKYLITVPREMSDARGV